MDDLIRVIDTLLYEMQAHGAHWQALLDKLNVINMNYMQVTQPLHWYASVYPGTVRSVLLLTGSLPVSVVDGRDATIVAAVHRLPQVC